MAQSSFKQISSALSKLFRPTHLLIFVATQAHSQSSQIEVLDIRGAVQQSLNNNPSLKAAKEKVAQSSSAISGAWSMYFPSLNASLTYDRNKDAVNLGSARFNGEPFNSYRFNVGLSQPIINIGAINGLRLKYIESDLASLENEIVVRDHIGKIAKAFSQIIYWQQMTSTQKNLHEVMKDSLRAVQSRVNIGRSDRIDALQMRTQLALTEPRIAEAENGVRNATATLVELMGTNDLKSIAIKGDLEAPSPDELAKIIDLKQTRLLQLQKIELETQKLDAQKSANLSSHWPSLSLEGTWGRQAYIKGELFDDTATQWSLGLALKIPLFSGLSSIHERSVLASQQAQQQHLETALRNQTSLDQIRSLENLKLAYSQIQSNKIAQKLAEEAQSEGRRQYRLGTIDLSQLLNIQRSVLDASVALENARIRYVESLIYYFVSTGLSIDLLISILNKEGLAP